MSNLGTNTIEPLFGSSNNNTFRTVIEEVLLDTTWKNSDSDSGLKSIKAGIDAKRIATDTKKFSNGHFACGYYNPSDRGAIPAGAFTKLPPCTILKQVAAAGAGLPVPDRYTLGAT